MVVLFGFAVLQYTNYNLKDFVTPVDPDVLDRYLKETNYDPDETEFLVQGFRKGFDLGYRGPSKIQRYAPNLKLEVGNEVILWNKIMKEVKLGRYAGPFSSPPFKYFIQSPVGLVPKGQNGTDTRLIFHLSYPKDGMSVNSETPKEFCSVKYCDFGVAVRLCLKAGQSCYVAKTDMASAFRVLGISKRYWKYLLLKATNPADGVTYFFVDKNCPFGSSSSCALFQRVSDGLAHIVKIKNGNKAPVNYLDDFLFIALLRAACNMQLQSFLNICQDIGFPISMEKTV